MALRKIFFSFILFIGFTHSFAQLRFSRINEDQGLSQRIVNCILQDKKGFMWFGTQDGLNKYDGYKMVVYKNNPSDHNSISDNSIETILETKDGNIWIGTHQGVDIYNPVKNSFKHLSDKMVDGKKVKAIFQDSQNHVWIGTEKGIVRYNSNTQKLEGFNYEVPITAPTSSESVWTIVEDSKGTIWMGTYGNFIYFLKKDSKKFVSCNISSENYSNIKSVRLMSFDSDHNLYIATENGLIKYDTEKKEPKEIYYDRAETSVHTILSKRVSSFCIDSNKLWIGSIYGGLNLVDKATKKVASFVNDPDDDLSLSDNNVRCLFMDDNGSLWIGTDNGISVFFESANEFSLFKNFGPEKKPVNVYSLMVDKRGKVWIGTEEQGLKSYDKETKTYWSHDDIPTGSNHSVLSLLEDKDGIWIGTWGDGLKYYDFQKQKVTKFYNLGQHGSNSKGDILAIVDGGNDKLWIGTYGEGIFSLNKSTGSIMQFTKQNGLSSNYIYCIVVDKNGNLLIGTQSNGLNIFDPVANKVTQFVKDSKNEKSLSSNAINCIYRDKRNRLWLGTSVGLNLYNEKDKSFEKYYEKDGLPSDYIYGIIEDAQGSLWLSTNNGISRFNPNVENVKGSAFRNYQVSDGLQGKEYNQGAFFKSKNGEMFFGGTNGFNSFFPEKIIGNNHKPNVYITEIKKFGKTLPLDSSTLDKKHIQLSWRDNFISFEFVGLDYLMPLQNKYSFKMEGVDEEWSQPSTYRFASYTQLEPNDYVFRVRVANSYGVWNDEGASISIKIIPPFWKTKWFYALCILVFIAGVIGFIRWRTASIKKEKKILELKVEERTRELAEKNRDITSSIQYAKRIQEAILPPVESIYSHFPDSFILYKPKDIVSGDFYWFAEKNGKKIIAAVDCTGHGVPGAFMSMIGHNLLNHIVVENGITDPATILNELHRGVQAALKQGSNVVDTSDGMDVALCCFDEKLSQVTFAGAFRPLFILSENKLEKISGNKFSIGGAQLDLERQFTNHTIFLKKGDKVYMFSDGYADQFGGDKGKKFMLKKFSDILLTFENTKMQDQKHTLSDTIESWSMGFEQVDDILVIGISV